MEREARQQTRWGGRRVLVAGVMVVCLVVSGCRGVPRGLLTRLAESDDVAAGPIRAGVAELDADQPVVRHRNVLEVPPELGAPPRHALLLAAHREAVAKAAIPQATPLGPLTPVPSGPGLVVAEPMAPRGKAAVRDFGAGCGRWLQLAVGGHGELGQTPLWTDVDRTRRQLGRPDLRLNRAQARNLAAMLGVTHVAIGEIQGSPSRCTLTYRLLKLPEGHEVGAPLVRIGTAEQVKTGLPQLARSLASRLGVTSPRVLPRVNASVAELSELGRLPWLPGSAVSLAARGRLERTAARLPLAGLLLLNSDWMHDEVRLHHTVERLLRQAPDHPLVLGEIAAVAHLELVRHPRELDRCLRRFPRHGVLVLAALFRQRLRGDSPQPHGCPRAREPGRRSQ